MRINTGFYKMRQENKEYKKKGTALIGGIREWDMNGFYRLNVYQCVSRLNTRVS